MNKYRESLKDKSRTSAEIAQGAKRNVLNRSSVTTTTNERWVKLSDAEEEINHIEDVWVAVNNGKTLIIKEQGEEIQTLQSKLEQAERERRELVDMNDKDYKELQSEIVKTIRKLQQLETGIKELKEEMNLLDLQLNAKRYLNK